MYDKNGDSKITLDEFGDVIKSLGLNPNKEQLATLMQEIDLDGSGTVDFNEFAIWMSIKMSPDKFNKSSDLESTFRIFDENGDHFITSSELKNVMKKLGQTLTDEEIDMMITEADTDGDKQVNYKGLFIYFSF
jgi:Ca2+-binding EF-hand superfamily protein